MNPSVRRALLSVSDKTGLIEFAQGLAGLGVELISTGGTGAALKEAGLGVTDVSALTGFPEIMDGRVKTLHPKIHGGLLAVRGNGTHAAHQAEHGIADIDLLVVNFYPFEAALAHGAHHGDLVERIDIGGPAMTRAAAKNHVAVTVVVDPEDYASVLAELRERQRSTSPELRTRLAAKAFSRTAAYDSAVSAWLLGEADERAPPHRAIGGHLVQTLRYGENPHQWAAYYATGTPGPSLASSRQVQGKELSYNNINDASAALDCVSEFTDEAACVIVKHANPCGVATAASSADAYRLALRCDPVSAYGGIVAFNRALDAVTAREIAKLFTEVIIAPMADDEVLSILVAKPNLRLLLTEGMPDPNRAGAEVKTVSGGFLMQSRDASTFEEKELKVVTRRQPTDRERADLLFAFRVAKHVKSNAIVFAKDGATVGIGAGQMSRVDSTRIAAWKSGDATAAAGGSAPLIRGSVVASDAFFPFPDGLLEAAKAGATAVIQPGGSLRDDDVIAAADEAGMAMLFTGQRHFRH